MSAIRLADISNELGVSIAAVSMALDDHPRIGAVTRQRVQAYCREIGYVTTEDLAERRLKRRRKQRQAASLRFLYVALCREAREPDNALVVPVANALREAGHRLEVISVTESDETPAMLAEAANDADAMLLANAVSAKLVRRLTARLDRCIVFGHAAYESALDQPPLPCPVVRSDAMGMGRQSVAWLLRQGHRRIGLYAFDTAPGTYNRCWLDGCRSALLAAGLCPDPELEHLVTVDASAPAQIAAYYSALAEPPTAMATPGGWIADGFIHAMRERGHLFERHDIVVGGMREANYLAGIGDHPQITIDPHRLARVAAQSLALTAQGLLTGPIVLEVGGDPMNLNPGDLP